MASSSFPHVMLRDARVQAFRAPVVDWPQGFRGGPVLLDDALQQFRHCRRGEPYDHFDSEASYTQRIEGEYIYAGPLYPHFGHFMAEMVHRILPAKSLGLRGRYLFVLPAGALDGLQLTDLPSPIQDALGFLGVKDQNSLIINENTVVERLHLVAQGCQLNADPRRDYLELLRDYSSQRLDDSYRAVERPRKLYVSRSALPKPGGILGERHLDSALHKEGFTIFRPERFSFVEQMDHYRKADVVVFAEGSACHGTELLGTGMLGTCVLIPRSPQAPLFVQLLKPRSRRFVEIDANRYLGTAAVGIETSEPLFHRGVSALIPDRLRQGFADTGIASLKDFNDAKYAVHKLLDVLGYLRSPIPEGRLVGWQERIRLVRRALNRKLG